MGKKSRRDRSRSHTDTSYSPEERSEIVKSLLQSLANNHITVVSEPKIAELLKLAANYKEQGARIDFSIPVNNGNHQLVGTFPNSPTCPSEVKLKKV